MSWLGIEEQNLIQQQYAFTKSTRHSDVKQYGQLVTRVFLV